MARSFGGPKGKQRPPAIRRAFFCARRCRPAGCLARCGALAQNEYAVGGSQLPLLA